MENGGGKTSTDHGTRADFSVLVPVDGSEASGRAVQYAATLNADRIVLMRVVAAEEPRDTDSVTDPYTRWYDIHIASVRDELALLKDQYSSAAGSVETEIRHGDPAEQIMDSGRSFDLIVMSTHGRGAAGRMIFGSVGDRVVRYGTAPTLLIRVGSENKTHVNVTRLVLALDGSELAEKALSIVARLARMLDVPILLVRCVAMEDVLATLRNWRSGPSSGSAEASDDDPYEQARIATEAAASDYLEGVRARFASDGVAVTTEVRGGTPVFELLWTVGEGDVIVVTSRGMGGYQRWKLGSTAERLVREAECPVLLVPTQTEGQIGPPD